MSENFKKGEIVYKIIGGEVRQGRVTEDFCDDAEFGEAIFRNKETAEEAAKCMRNAMNSMAKEKEPITEKFYNIGQHFKYLHGDHRSIENADGYYLLAEVGRDMVNLFDSEDGTAWGYACPVKNVNLITEEEFAKLCGVANVEDFSLVEK
jgi:hypothetical protein